MPISVILSVDIISLVVVTNVLFVAAGKFMISTSTTFEAQFSSRSVSHLHFWRACWISYSCSGRGTTAEVTYCSRRLLPHDSSNFIQAHCACDLEATCILVCWTTALWDNQINSWVILAFEALALDSVL